MTTDTTAERLTCANHPDTPTALRCNRCGKPICTRCIVRTPVGYRCRECVRGQQQIFETAVWTDFVVALVLALVLGAGTTWLLTQLRSFIFLAILMAPVAGGLTAQLISTAVRRRRSRYLPVVAAAAFAFGSVAVLAVPAMLFLLLSGGQNLGGLTFSLLIPLIFTALATSTLYMRLRGIAL
jgi:hypothetical protein